MKTALLLAAASSVVLAGCQTVSAVSPASDIVAPRYALGADIDAKNAADLDWREVFVDPRLQRLIDIALMDSRPLRFALIDAEAAQSQLRLQRSAFFPQIGASAGYSRSRAASVAGFENLGAVDQTQVGFGVSAFELDLFGRLRSQSESAFQSYLAAEDGAQAARIALSATVADAYVAVVSARERLSVTEATVEDWQASERLTRLLYDAGQANGSDLATSQAQVRGVEADLEAARRSVQVTQNALTLAIGRPIPEQLLDGVSFNAPPVLTSLPAGLPSDLLTRRPDVRQAEHLLFASQADIRAARRAFFPTISLTGQYGYASPNLDDLFNGGEIWSFGPQITMPIFQGGRLQAQLDLAVLRQNSAVAGYELTIQRAFGEVSDGLAARETFDRQIASQELALEAGARRARLASARFDAGVTSRLELLDAQRELYAIRIALTNARASQYSASIALFRALGGGPSETSGPVGG